MTFDDFKKQRRSIFDRLRKDLQQVTFLVPVGEYAELSQSVDGFVNRPDALRKVLVISWWHAEKLQPARLEMEDRFDNIARGQGDMLHAWPPVIVEIFLY